MPVASSMDAIFEDPTIDVIAGAAMPAERAAISIKAMQHGKDVLTDKPVGNRPWREIDEIERVQRDTEAHLVPLLQRASRPPLHRARRLSWSARALSAG